MIAATKSRTVFLVFLTAASAPLIWAAQPPELQGKKIPSEILKVRDPFKRPATINEGGAAKTELELFPVEQFKLVGISTGPLRIRAILLAPNGKTYFAAERMKIGLRGGEIRRITPSSVLVRETILNVVGERENIDLELTLSERSVEDLRQASGGG